MPVRKSRLLGRQEERPVCMAGVSSAPQGKTRQPGKRKVHLCLWKVQLLLSTPCLEGMLHLCV